MADDIDEIAPDVYRLATVVEDVPPAGFTFNQFLVVDDEPLLHHTGPRVLFPAVSAAVEQVRGDLRRLRWVSFSHHEGDESGSINEWLLSAPHAEVACNELGCELTLADIAVRPPRVLTEDEPLPIGAKRLRMIPTPHVPHNWESQVLFEEVTGTLFGGDIRTQLGDRGLIVEDDVYEPALEADDLFAYQSLSAHTGATLRQLAALEPSTLAIMHGASSSGEAAPLLDELAREYDQRVIHAVERGGGEVHGKGCPDIPATR